MAVSIPNPKRASAIAFLNGDSNGSDAMYSSTNDPLSLNSRTDNQDILGDWRGVSSALDINLDNRELGAERGNLPLSNVHTPFDVIGSESTLLDTVIQKASTPLPFGSERTSSTPLDNAFGIWGQGLGVPNPVKAKALMLDDGWDLTFSPPGLAGNDRIQSVGPLGSPSALSQLSSHRPLSTPIYSSGGAYGELLNSGSVDQSFGSGKLTSHLSTSALEALNGINNLVTEQDWSRQSRPINSLNDILENPFICSGAPAGALGGVISLEGAAGLYKVPNNSANFLERTPSAPLFDSNPYAFHGGVLRGSTPVGGNLSSGNLAGLLPRSTTPSQHPNSLHHGHFAHQNSFTNSSPNKLSFRGVDDSAVENVVANTCHQILLDAMYHSLKAVELANTLRARVGQELLALVREKWGGLLSLLERHPDRFVVERIPKNDRVSLATASNMERATDSGNAGATGISTAGGAESVGNGSVPVTHSTSGDVVDGTAVAPIRIGEDGKEIEEGVEESADMDEDMSNASRCLHVGNVPVGYTEVQLMREFEKFGTLEGLKLISQKNNVRRFAFVTFKTVAQAMTAKHCLSKVYPWKSAISFAHKDISGNGGGHMHGYGHGHGHGQSVAMHTQGHSHLPHGAVAHGTNAGFNGFNKRSNNLHMQKPHALQSHRGMTQMHGHGQPGGPMGYLLSQRTGSPSTGGYHHHHSYLDPTAIMSTSMGSPQHLEHHAFASEEESSGGVAGFMNHSNGQLAQPAAAHGHRAVVAHAIKDPAVLQRLCDDTYVPTQPWPTDSISDPILISAIQHQLLEFNGTTTISKLRGYLKHRIGVSDNIKSVPLKALLLAYPQHFSVEGNIVSMLPTSATL